jgi:hypothetical protein
VLIYLDISRKYRKVSVHEKSLACSCRSGSIYVLRRGDKKTLSILEKLLPASPKFFKGFRGGGLGGAVAREPNHAPQLKTDDGYTTTTAKYGDTIIWHCICPMLNT